LGAWFVRLGTRLLWGDPSLWISINNNCPLF
jgi:hypothetical protein